MLHATSVLRTWACVALLAFSAPMSLALANGATSFPETVPIELDGPSTARPVRLGVNKSLIVELPVDVKDVLVSSPKVADAVMRSTRKAFIIGAEVGHTNVFFFDGAGRQILALDVSVEHDTGALQSTLRRLVPGAEVNVEGVNGSVALTGSVASAADSKKANEVAAKFVGSAEKVVNMLTIRGGEQVLLKVTIAEVERTAIKQLGVKFDAEFSVGGAVFAAVTQSAFPIANSLPGNIGGALWEKSNGDFFRSTIRLLEERGLLRTLAEPTLTAISGENASFLAGGEFPVPVGQDEEGRVTIEFKQYGVGLSFTPVVVSEGRISLKVQTEVSELTQEGAFSLGVGDNTSLVIPGLKVRRANTTVELPSGGALAIAGLLQDDVKQALSGVPGLMKLPILGPLFRSRDYQRGQTELVVMVTPFIATHAHRNDLARPDDGFAAAADPEALFLGRLHKVYGNGQAPKGVYKGSYGFITD